MPSSVIRVFFYDETTRRLKVVFATGRRYSYLDVPPALAEGMRAALSKGEYFNAHVRDRYVFTRDD